MKKFLTAGVAAIGLAAMATASLAADWTPPGPIKMMIAFRAGGGVDTQARLIAEELEARNGWKIIPEQVTGKGGVNLLAAIKEQPNDGTVIGMLVTESMGYNLAASGADMVPGDFTAITTTSGSQMGIVALTSKGWTTFSDVVDAAKAGTAIRIGSISPNTADIGYLLGKAQGIDLNIVPVKGGKGALNGLNAGDIDIAFVAGPQAKGVVAGDLVNLLSVRNDELMLSPDAPLISEFGVDFVAEAKFVFVGPAGMSAEAREAIATAISEVSTDESSKAGAFIKKAFGGALSVSGTDLTAAIQAEYDKAGELMKAASE